MRMWRGCKSPAEDVSATNSNRSIPLPSRPASGGLQRVEPGPGYDEEAALQAALEASAREHAARTGRQSVRSSFMASKHRPAPHDEERELQQALELSKRSRDEQLAFELQQQEVERAQAAAAATQPSASQPADPFAALAGLTAPAPSTKAPLQPQVQQQPRPSNNPFAPDRRMPWDIRPAFQPAPAGSVSGPSQDPFASLPPLVLVPSMPAQPPAQPLAQPPAEPPAYPPCSPVQQYSPPGVPQQQPQYGASWQASFPEPRRNNTVPNGVSVPQQQRPSTADDEALARALQQQLDLEEPPRPQPDSRDEALAKALQEQLDREAQPSQNGFTGSRPIVPAPAPPPLQPVTDWNLCGGCREPVNRGWGTETSALGRSWHKGCFCCGHCKRPIGGSFMADPSGRLPYHSECHRLVFDQRCCVCADLIPEVPGRGIEFITHPLWKEQRSCPAHQHDGTLSCTACNRLCPRSEQWAQLEEGRHICLSCLDSIVMDSQDAQPLYSKVMAFFESMGMRLPERPPLMLVEYSELNSAEAVERRLTAGGPVFHTRGLMLSQEYSEIRTVARNRSTGGMLPFFSIRPEITHIRGPAHTEVTAILVQYGMPWLLTGSILAHELMHAYLRLAGYRQLSLDVEEGLCQLMALLWLEHQPPAPEGTWDERLSSYFAHQIRTDPSHVYGDGFRAAHEAFQKHGLGATLASVRATGRLPLDRDVQW